LVGRRETEWGKIRNSKSFKPETTWQSQAGGEKFCPSFWYLDIYFRQTTKRRRPQRNQSRVGGGKKTNSLSTLVEKQAVATLIHRIDPRNGIGGLDGRPERRWLERGERESTPGAVLRGKLRHENNWEKKITDGKPTSLA